MPKFNKQGRGVCHFIGVGSHHLPSDRVVFEPGEAVLGGIAKTAFFAEDVWIFACAALTPADERSIKQGLGDAVGATVAAGDESHCRIRVTRESGLEEWSIETGDERGDTRVNADPSGEAEEGLIAGRLRALGRWCVSGHWVVGPMVGFLHALHDSDDHIAARIMPHTGF